jgi:3'-phosphoadenosine 5'-phosphosulfate sulfotransferase (PAPS reductase)/FAD synthetase
MKNTGDRSINILHDFHKLPLYAKIDKAMERIDDFYKEMDGKVYVSFSGGKDSTVLLHIARKVYPRMKGVFLDAGLEWPEVKAYVKSFDNIEIIRPKMTYRRILEQFGYPVISKRVSQAVRKGLDAKDSNTRNMLLGGCGPSKYSIPKMYRYLLGIPYRISDECCLYMKKEPLHAYDKRTGEAPYIGTLADESKSRTDDWLSHGCNITGVKRQSRPLMMWNQEAIWEYARQEKIKFVSVYRYVERTSCLFCGFGIHGPEGLQKYAALKLLKPKIYDACMDKLGMRNVLTAIGHDVEKEVEEWIPKLVERSVSYKYADCCEMYNHATAVKA